MRRTVVCECCEAEATADPLAPSGWVCTIDGDFCPECAASLKAETERLIALMPKRIGLCPQEQEFFVPLDDSENLTCPNCEMTLIIYTREEANGDDLRRDDDSHAER